MTMTKPIDRLSMQNAINTATKILGGFSNSNQFLSGSQKNDSAYRITLVNSALQGPDVCVETKFEEMIHVTPHPVSVTPTPDIQQ